MAVRCRANPDETIPWLLWVEGLRGPSPTGTVADVSVGLGPRKWLAAHPTDTLFYENGHIRHDGRMMRDMYLFEVETATESKDVWGTSGIIRDQRTAPHLWKVCEDMFAICPGAIMLQYVNPMAINTWRLPKNTDNSPVCSLPLRTGHGDGTVPLQKFLADGAHFASGRNYSASSANCCLKESAFAVASTSCCVRIM